MCEILWALKMIRCVFFSAPLQRNYESTKLKWNSKMRTTSEYVFNVQYNFGTHFFQMFSHGTEWQWLLLSLPDKKSAICEWVDHRSFKENTKIYFTWSRWKKNPRKHNMICVECDKVRLYRFRKGQKRTSTKITRTKTILPIAIIITIMIMMMMTMGKDTKKTATKLFSFWICFYFKYLFGERCALRAI